MSWIRIGTCLLKRFLESSYMLVFTRGALFCFVFFFVHNICTVYNRFMWCLMRKHTELWIIHKASQPSCNYSFAIISVTRMCDIRGATNHWCIITQSSFVGFMITMNIILLNINIYIDSVYILLLTQELDYMIIMFLHYTSMYRDHTWSEDYGWDNIATSVLVNGETQYRTNSKTTMSIMFSANNSFTRWIMNHTSIMNKIAKSYDILF